MNNNFYITCILEIPDQTIRAAFLGKNKYFIANLLSNQPRSRGLWAIDFPQKQQNNKEIFTYNRLYLETITKPNPNPAEASQKNEPPKLFSSTMQYPRKHVKCTNSEEPAVLLWGSVEGLIPSIILCQDRLNTILKTPNMNGQPAAPEQQPVEKPKEIHIETDIRARILFNAFCPMMLNINNYFASQPAAVKTTLLSDYHFYGIEFSGTVRKVQQSLRKSLEIILGQQPKPVQPQQQPQPQEQASKPKPEPAEPKPVPSEAKADNENQKKKKNKKKSKKNKSKKEKPEEKASTVPTQSAETSVTSVPKSEDK